MTLEDVREGLGKALAEEGSRLLLRLTDEELAALNPAAAESSIVATPHLEGMSAQEREWVLATALRSLVSRDLVEIANAVELDVALREGHGSDEVELDMRLSPDLELVLALRGTAGRVLAVERTTSAGTEYVYVYLHTRDLLLVEQVTGGGMHSLSLVATVEEAAETIRQLVDPQEVAGHDGFSQEIDPQDLRRDAIDPPLKDVIDNALVVGQLVLLADLPGPLLMTYATAEELWAVSVDAPDAPTGVTARCVGRQTLVDRIVHMMAFPV
ncbi:hypothetical protein [Streptomyces sp. DASNCL29]|uniref:hypothetical protein n=1 Tax=Streptomyces sp. DASNCL29 TaxID=2583819 RepID=UPI00110F7200|nr:hypothetical protein [Streptomyces sp. DASNCL29]TMU90710.1 hypothetical protein FGK60_45245 [Streptomyces sp. DASNCL29]